MSESETKEETDRGQQKNGAAGGGGGRERQHTRHVRVKKRFGSHQSGGITTTDDNQPEAGGNRREGRMRERGRERGWEGDSTHTFMPHATCYMRGAAFPIDYRIKLLTCTAKVLLPPSYTTSPHLCLL